MIRRNSAILSAVAVAAIPTIASAVETSDESAYDLFHPVPAGQLRELSTDRPDKTESPNSVDAGHYQFEASLVSLERSSVAGADVTETTFLELNAKAGLTANTDLQLVLVPMTTSSVSLEGFGETSTNSAFPEAQVRFKWNLTGNDGGDVALALLPFASLPVQEGEGFQAGLSVPVGFSLPSEFSLGLMATIESFESRDFSTMATLGHDIAGDLAGYVEFFNTMPEMGMDGWIATLDLGVTYALSTELQLDAGANIGLTESSPGLEAFAGVSARF